MKNRPVLLAAAGLATVMALAGCSTETSASNDTGDSAAAVDVSSYQTAAEAAMEPITEFTGPSTGPEAKADVKAMYIACGFAAEGCKVPADAAVEAGEAIGWDVTAVDGLFDPQVYSRSIDDAINQGFDVIILSSVSSEAVAEQVKKARAAGIVVGSYGSGNTASDTGVNYDVPTPGEEMGEGIANFLVWQTEGQLVADLLLSPEFGTTVIYQDTVKKVIEGCATCSIAKTDTFTSPTASTTLPTTVTSNLTQNPEINAVIAPYDTSMFSVIPAMIAAGQTSQLVTGYDGTSAMLQFIRDGKAAATEGSANGWGAWAAIDNANRILQGEEPVDQNVPSRLFTADNVDQVPAGQQWDGDVDYQAAFTKIWSGQ